MKYITLVLFILLGVSLSLYGAEIDTLGNKIYFQSKSKDNYFDRFTALKLLGKELSEYSSTFHPNVLKDIEEGKVLYGQQLTLLHKVVACYLSLSYQLERISETDDLSLSLIANLERLNIFNSNYAGYYQNKKFRRLVEAEDESYNVARKEIRKNIREIISRKNISKINKQIIKFQKRASAGRVGRYDVTASNIINHPVFKMVQDQKKFRKLRHKYFGQKILDFEARLSQQLVQHLSGAFGNAVGAVRWRKGHLLNDKELLNEIAATLRPLDVITEKTWFALTDSFIPGHFGHNAIWLGTKTQLQEIGMWEHPSIIPIHKFIEEGKTIIEVDRSGTHLKSLSKFMNIDEFAILRLNGGAFTSERMNDVYKVAIAQLGKSYDFNFDVETTDKLVCSELLYQAFGNIHWPTEDYLGRTTISPDNVVSLALFESSPFELIYYVAERHKGKRVYKDLDALAHDIGFTKRSGTYMKPETKCHYEDVVRSSSRFGENSREKKCHTEYIELNYSAHAWIPDFH